MNIRPAIEADAEAITGVHIASMQEAYQSLFRREALAQIDTHDRTQRWREHLARATSVTVLAEADGHLVGFADFGACRDEDVSPGAVGELLAMYVRPDAWGRSVGRALMWETLERLQSDGFAEVVLWVIEENQRALDFYRRFGFIRDGSVRHRTMYGTETTVVRLHRRAGVETAEPVTEAFLPRE